MTQHNTWFEEKFLASLKNGQWITEKQVAVCRRYMVESRYYGGKLLLASGNTRYTVNIMKKGYGRFYKEEFEFNIEEKVTDINGDQYTK